ncbi:MAG: FIST C-terminal domain-containing protein [Gammaproteobacteria bacterium]|nr:FIST C-terminal domain-containing protein [Gammaproteobacteria bacterium]
MRRNAATGLARGARAEPTLAAEAVKQALDRANLDRARSVLLFLTPHFAPHPDAALRAAARAAGSLQISGCTGAGVFTEDEWLLDTPGAAAMVFGESFGFTADATDGEPLLSLCTPAGLAAEWLDTEDLRLGGVSGDLFGHGPFRVWANARILEGGRTETALANTHGIVDVSQGMRALTAPIEVVEVEGMDVLRLGNYPALNVLVQSLPHNVRSDDSLPLHLILGGVTFGDPHTAIREGRYRLNHIVAANLRNRSVTLTHALAPGERLFWGMRDALTAERDFRATIEHAGDRLGTAPEFALLFPCMGRGPHFYGNRDRDLDQIKSHYPGLPVIGFYGNGEIGPLDGLNHLYQYSTVLGLFASSDSVVSPPGQAPAGTGNA